MVYTQEVKQKIERLKSVFGEYIHTSPYLDLVWSEKLGYILLYVNPNPHDFGLEPGIISDDSHFVELMCECVSMDIWEMTPNEHSTITANSLERAVIKRRFEPFVKQLPAYSSLIDWELSAFKDCPPPPSVEYNSAAGGGAS